MARTLTAANSVYMLAIPLLYPIAQQLQGYAADAAFETEASDPVEVMMGVDGKKSSGFVPFLTKQTINLQADSASAFIFENWLQAMKSAQEDLTCNAVIRIPSIQRSYVLTNGSLTSAPSIPVVGKILKPRAFVITWESIVGAAI